MTNSRRVASTRWLLALAALLFGAAVPSGQPAAQTPRRVAVTVDDLPANMLGGDQADWERMTADLLAGLATYDVPAIGFVNENKLASTGSAPDARRVALLQAWLDAGLELGNHSFSHPDLHSTPLAEFQADVLRGEEVTRRLLAARGTVPRYFRHPFLHTGLDLTTRDGLHEFLATHGYQVAPVTMDNLEYIAARAYDHALIREDPALARRIAAAYIEYMTEVTAYYEQQAEALFGRDIAHTLLIHANRLNAAVIDDLLGMFVGRGYAFVSLEEALQDAAYQSPDKFTGRGGITWLHRWALTAGKRGAFFGTEPDLPRFVHEVYADPPSRP
jgi:peptidoglycan/xylan/chitin deacetylase (PgdA/CDA1 family)